MKTRIIITTAFIFCIGLANVSGNSFLTFTNGNGTILIQPIMPEEAEEQIPFFVEAEMEKIAKNKAFHQFDLSGMTKPEEEEALPFELKTVFKTVKK